VVLSVLVTAQLASDGRSGWLNGTQLLVVYFALARTFFSAPIADINHQCLMVARAD
jgi:Ca2+:H+ antiporter